MVFRRDNWISRSLLKSALWQTHLQLHYNNDCTIFRAITEMRWRVSYIFPPSSVHLSHAWVNIFPVRMLGILQLGLASQQNVIEWAQWKKKKKTTPRCRPKNASLHVINFFLCTEWDTAGITLLFLFPLQSCFEDTMYTSLKKKIQSWKFKMKNEIILFILWSIPWLMQWCEQLWKWNRPLEKGVLHALQKQSSLLFKWTNVSCLLLIIQKQCTK